MKKIFKTLSLLLVLILVFTMSLTGCSKKQDPYKSDYTVGVLSTAIRTLSDSEFREYDLLKFIYAHAFSYSTAVSSFIPKDLEETLPTMFGDDANELFAKTAVAFGGTAVQDKTVGELTAVSTVEQSKLYVGDVLFTKNGDACAHYIYDKDGLVNLSAPLENVDTAAVLAALPQSEQFAVLRLTYAMEGKKTLVDEPLSDKNFTEAQKALVATAQSYLLRGDKLQYVSLKDGLNSGHYVGVKSPEDHTSDNYGPLQCSGFCYDVYYQALGFEIKYDGEKLNSSVTMRKYAEELGIQKHVMTCKNEADYTEEDKARISKELLDLLEPGDILLTSRVSGGHVLLYVGNGNIIHADGSSYSEKTYTEVYEPTVRQQRFVDYFLTEGGNGYLFAADTGRKVTELMVLRPLDVWNGEIPEATKNRMQNLSGVMAQKLSSHNISLTADVGEEITYTFELYNQNDKEITLAVCDVVSANSTYVSGAETVSGSTLSWQVTLPANTRKTVSYVVKVAEGAKRGDEVVSTGGLVGGVPVNCPAVVVGNTLSAAELQTLKDTITSYQPSENANGFAIVNDIYKQAFGWEAIFTETEFAEVYEGESGLLEQKAEMVKNKLRFWLELREDSGYRQMVAPNLYGGYGTKEGAFGSPVVMPAKQQQFVVGDIIIAKIFDEEHLYLYAGDGVLYDVMNGYKLDERNVRGRMEYFLNTDFAYAVLRPSLVH